MGSATDAYALIEGIVAPQYSFTEESRSGADRQRNAEQRMRKRSTIAGVIGVGLLLSATSYADPYNPAERAIGGGLVGAGTGALIGAIAGGGHGAAMGAAVGGGLGAVAGAATTPARPRGSSRHYHYVHHRYYRNY